MKYILVNGEKKRIATKRNDSNVCSENCPGIYRYEGGLYCSYFDDYAVRGNGCFDAEKEYLKTNN